MYECKPLVVGMGVRGCGGRPQMYSSPSDAAGPTPAHAPEVLQVSGDFADRRVLRFFCSWDDRGSAGGELHRQGRTLAHFSAQPAPLLFL